MFLAKHTSPPLLGDSFQVFNSKLSEVLVCTDGGHFFLVQSLKLWRDGSVETLYTVVMM
jgi:hypothetical protein